MKVILLTDIPKVGNKNEVKDFKEGYAQNVLLSKGLAILATPHNLSLLEAKKNKIKKEKDEQDQIFKNILDTLADQTIKLKVLANEKGHLFKSITKKDIVNEIKKISDKEIDEDFITMDPIKELGIHNIEVKKGDNKTKLQIEIVK